MASLLQIEANRKNSLKCTGPRTAEGKAVASQNALKTGIDAQSEIIRFESRADYEALTAEYFTHYHPATPEQRCLVDILIKSEWLSRRYMSVETAVWERTLTDMDKPSLGRAYMRSSEIFARVDRRISSAQRNFAAALKQLLALQAADQPELEPEPDPAPVNPPSPIANALVFNTPAENWFRSPESSPDAVSGLDADRRDEPTISAEDLGHDA